MLKSVLGKIAIAFLISPTFLTYCENNKIVAAAKEPHPTVKSSATKHRGHYKKGMNPGMMVRLEQKSMDALKYSMQHFFPHFISRDMELPPSVEFEVGGGDFLGGIFTRNVTWTDINYINAVWNIVGIKLEFLADDEGLGQKVHIDFPVM
jgi:hypothetical protein